MNYTPLTNLVKIPESIDPTVAATFVCPGPIAIHACCLAEGAGVELSKINIAVVQGLDILRNRGVYLVPGQYSASGGVEIQPQMIIFKVLHIIGSSQYSMIDVHKYLEFLDKNPDLNPLIEKLGPKYKVEQINETIIDAKSGNNIKTLLVK